METKKSIDEYVKEKMAEREKKATEIYHGLKVTPDAKRIFELTDNFIIALHMPRMFYPEFDILCERHEYKDIAKMWAEFFDRLGYGIKEVAPAIDIFLQTRENYITPAGVLRVIKQTEAQKERLHFVMLDDDD